MTVYVGSQTYSTWVGSAPAQFYTASSSPTITSVTPNSGPAGPVVIRGTNYVSGATVSFGGAPATGVTVVSATEIDCTAPAHADGAVTVTVSTPVGTSNGYTFTYVNATGGGDTTVMPTILGTTYYISPTGSDSNNGTSTSTPWQTLAKALTVQWRAIDAVFFQRGGTYYLPNTGYPHLNVGVTANASNRFVYGAYGTGAKPIITNKKILNNSGGWTNFATNIWRIDLSNPATHTGWTSSFMPNACNIGHLTIDGVVFGNKKLSTGALTTNWDFYSDNAQFLYVRATANPTTLAANIIAAPDARVFRLQDNMEMCGVMVEDTGGTSEVGDGPHNNVKITFCTFKNIGGSFLIGFSDNTVRYGNGIEIGMGSNGWTIEDNIIDDCYDADFSFQGDGGATANIFFRRNTVSHGSFGFELYATGTASMANVIVENNTFTDCGFGGLAPWRPNQDQRCTIMSANTGSTGSKSVEFRNNVVTRAFTAYRFHVSPNQSSPPWFNAHNNQISLVSGTKMSFVDGYTINNASSWATAANTEAGSTFTIL